MAPIEVSNLTKRYGEVLANDDLSFSVRDGEIFGYLDPNAVLIRGEYDLLGGLILLVAAVALVGVALAWFQRKDVN